LALGWQARNDPGDVDGRLFEVFIQDLEEQMHKAMEEVTEQCTEDGGASWSVTVLNKELTSTNE
jgi:ribosomal protein S3AE